MNDKLFRVTMKSVFKWDIESRTLYVIESSREAVIEYVNANKNDRFTISKIVYLGYKLSGIMFKGGKP